MAFVCLYMNDTDTSGLNLHLYIHLHTLICVYINVYPCIVYVSSEL